MGLGAEIESFSNALAKSVDEQQITDALFAFVRHAHMDKLAYHHLPPHQADDFDEKHFFARGYSTEKVNEYRRNHKIFSNPLMNYVGGTSEAITFRDACGMIEYSDSQRAYLADFYGPPRCAGLIVPVYGLKGRNGLFILAADTHDRTHSPDEIRHLKWACQEAHHKLCHKFMEKVERAVSLTQREKEILTWVARGKSNSVIADIIGISPHTVNGYLRTVYLKTGVSDRTSAALIGVSNALIYV